MNASLGDVPFNYQTHFNVDPSTLQVPQRVPATFESACQPAHLCHVSSVPYFSFAGSTTSACGSGETPPARCAATARTRAPPPRTAPPATPAQARLRLRSGQNVLLGARVWLPGATTSHCATCHTSSGKATAPGWAVIIAGCSGFGCRAPPPRSAPPATPAWGRGLSWQSACWPWVSAECCLLWPGTAHSRPNSPARTCASAVPAGTCGCKSAWYQYNPTASPSCLQTCGSASSADTWGAGATAAPMRQRTGRPAGTAML